MVLEDDQKTDEEDLIPAAIWMLIIHFDWRFTIQNQSMTLKWTRWKILCKYIYTSVNVDIVDQVLHRAVWILFAINQNLLFHWFCQNRLRFNILGHAFNICCVLLDLQHEPWQGNICCFTETKSCNRHFGFLTKPIKWRKIKDVWEKGDQDQENFLCIWGFSLLFVDEFVENFRTMLTH
jgi:hypothetical protein